ncbi:MAG TPA: hypothetical protein VHD90_03940 [Phototrophicaceae bacterium]|nr:hypothetical protein [Phototrophicaceae bacterium]
MADFIHSLTPDFFSALVIAFIVIGLALAIVRLYADFTRPLPPDNDEDTRPHRIIERERRPPEDSKSE